MAGRSWVNIVCRRVALPKLWRGVRNAALLSLSRAVPCLIALALATSPAAADAIKGEVSAVTENGFTRLVFVLSDDVEPQVRVANNVITVTFQRPVEINVDRISVN